MSEGLVFNMVCGGGGVTEDFVKLSGRNYEAMHDHNLFLDELENYGYINLSGNIPSHSDTLWEHSEPALIGNAKRVVYKMLGYNTVATVIVYDNNMTVLDTVHASVAGPTPMEGAYVFPTNAVYWAFSGGSLSQSQQRGMNYPYVYLEG